MDMNNIRIAGQTALSIYNTTQGKVVLLIIALLFCFAGYKLLPSVCSLVGVVLGVACGTCLTSLFGSSWTEIMNLIFTVLSMVVLGIVCGIICFKFYHLAVFLIFAAVGAGVIYLPGLFVAEHSRTAFWILLAVCAIIFGLAAVLFLRPVCIIATSCFGFAAAFPMTALLNQAIFVRTIAIGCALTILGCIFQLITNRRQLWPHTEKLPEEAAASDEPEEVLETVDDITQVLDVHAVQQENPDEIDEISDLVAAQIGMEEQAAEPLTQPLGYLAEDLEKTAINTKKIQEPRQETKRKPKKTKKYNLFGILLSLVLLAAALFFAAVGIQYAEIVLALVLACYVLKQYAVTILACAVLCVRRVIDAVMLFQSGGTAVQIIWSTASCLAFLIVTLIVLIAYTNARHAAKNK